MKDPEDKVREAARTNDRGCALGADASRQGGHFEATVQVRPKAGWGFGIPVPVFPSGRFGRGRSGDRGWLLGLVLLLLMQGLLPGRSADPEPEHARVSFQGRLGHRDGAAVPDGSYDMIFTFYDAASDGIALLAEKHVGPTNAVAVSGGLLHVLLGGGEIIAGRESTLWSVFLNHAQVYVGISVNSEAELRPRLPLTRTPYAVRAEDALTLAGRCPSDFLDATEAAQTKFGQLALVGLAASRPILDLTNTSSSGLGLRSVVASTNPAVLAVNEGEGPVLQARSGYDAVVFDVATNGDMTIAGRAFITGQVTASGGYAVSPARTGRVTLGPADFRPRHPTEEQFILWGYPWKPNRHYLVCTMERGSATFYADLHVPEAASLTRLVTYLYDVDPARSSTLNLARCSLLGHEGPDPVYLATNSSANGQIRISTPLSETVNTSASHYVLSLRLFWSDLGMQFFGVQVEYTYTELHN